MVNMKRKFDESKIRISPYVDEYNENDGVFENVIIANSKKMLKWKILTGLYKLHTVFYVTSCNLELRKSEGRAKDLLHHWEAENNKLYQYIYIVD